MCSLVYVKGKSLLSQILLLFLFHFFVCSLIFIYSMFSFFILVGSGKLTFSWPSPNHRVTVTGTSLPLSIHTLPCPSTNQPPCFTCHWPQRQTAQNKSAGSMGNWQRGKVMGLLTFCLIKSCVIWAL